jgi:EF hand
VIKIAANFEPELQAVLKKFDTDGDGQLNAEELTELKTDISLQDSQLRYAGYSAGFARLFRWGATSDIALFPIVHLTGPEYTVR